MSFFNNIYIPSLGLADIFEMSIFIFLIYYLIKSLKNTRAMLLLKGVFVLFIVYIIALILKLQAILVLFNSIIIFLVFAMIVVLQPEMRKFLEQIGTKNITKNFNFKMLFAKKKEVKKYYSDKSISELVKSCYAMGKAKTGALIAIEREIPLTEYIDTGIALNADITSQLIINIFEKNTPLHDGAVIQVGDKLVSATCYLPLSNSLQISKHMGTRHRAAIGLSEVTDSLVIIVSEETGSVSLAINGKVMYDLSKESFTSLLYQYQVNEKDKQLEHKKSEKESIKEIMQSEKFSNLLVAFVSGVVGWVLLMNVANPVITKTIEDVPITFINTSVIESTGRTFELISEDTVDVTITDERSIVDSIRREDLNVVADFTKLSYVNAVPLEGSVIGHSSTKVDFISDDIIKVELDSVISKEVKVELHQYIQKNSKTYVPILTTDTETIVITGGKTKIDTIDKVVCEYDVTNTEGVYEGVSDIVVFDKNGNILNNSDFSFSTNKIKATGNAYNIKSVPIEIISTSDYIGRAMITEQQIIGNYKLLDIEYEPKEIIITGPDEILEKFNNISIVVDLSKDIEKITNNQYIKTIDIVSELPENIYLVNKTEKDISVTFSFEILKQKEFVFLKNEIEIIGNNEELYNVVLEEDSYRIVINGEEEILNNLTKDKIQPFIDITSLAEGSYNLVLQFRGLDNVVLDFNISAKLQIQKK